MRPQMDLNKTLHLQTKFQRVQPGGIPGDVPFGLKPLAAASCLTGRQVQHFAQLVRGQVCVLLQGGKQSLVGRVQHVRKNPAFIDFCARFARLLAVYTKTMRRNSVIKVIFLNQQRNSCF